jgi:hypothetical protein
MKECCRGALAMVALAIARAGCTSLDGCGVIWSKPWGRGDHQGLASTYHGHWMLPMCYIAALDQITSGDLWVTSYVQVQASANQGSPISLVQHSRTNIWRCLAPSGTTTDTRLCHETTYKTNPNGNTTLLIVRICSNMFQLI